MTPKSFAKPYARALFELASSDAERNLWLNRLQVLAEVFGDHEIVRALARVSDGEAVSWLQSALGDRVDGATYSFLALLIENRRLSSLPNIAALFAELIRELQGTGVLSVTTAVALADKERAEALKLFEHLFKQKLIPQYRVDPLIQGGMVGQVNDLVYDGSLRGSLEKLRENLLR